MCRINLMHRQHSDFYDFSKSQNLIKKSDTFYQLLHKYYTFGF